MQTIEEAKNQANRLSARLSTLGVEVKRTQALEGVAAIHGFPSWNHMSAQLKDDDIRTAMPASTRDSDGSMQPDPMAMARYNIFAGPPGVGKSYTLGRLGLWLAGRSQRVVTINLCYSNVGNWWNVDAFHAAPVEIECTPEQDWEANIPAANGTCGDSLYLNLHRSPRDDFAGFLICLVRRLRKVWPYDWILIDELDNLVRRDPEVLDRLFSSCADDARMVVVTQSAPPPTRFDLETNVFQDWRVPAAD